jgi:thiamine-phosphate pyrophosphorylase
MAMRPRQWLIVNRETPSDAVARLPRGSGVLVVELLPGQEIRHLKQLARQRGLSLVVEERSSAVRVHNLRELRRALLARTPLVLLSPVFPTSSHPNWKPIPRMRAAALARLGGRRLVALGGMDARKFARIRRLGFQAWAGISAFRT